MAVEGIHWRAVADWLLDEVVYASRRGVSERALLQEAKRWEYDSSVVVKLLDQFVARGDVIRVGQHYWAKSDVRHKMVSSDVARRMLKLARRVLGERDEWSCN